MRHSLSHRKFSRSSSHRQAMFRNLATSLFQHERISTTIQKAKDLRPIAEKLITLGRVDSLHNRRQAYGVLQSKSIVHKLFTEIGPRYIKRAGGYTRIVRTTRRPGDAAELAVIELIQSESATVSKVVKTASKKKVGAEKAASDKSGTKKRAAKKESAEQDASAEVAKKSKKNAPKAKKKTTEK